MAWTNTLEKFLGGDGLIPLPLMPLSLVGTNPTVTAPTVMFEGMPQRDFQVERMLFSKVGRGRLSAVLYVGQSIESLEPFDPETFSVGGFASRLKLPMISAGMKIRLQLTWHPAAWTCRMTAEEFARRKRDNDWVVNWCHHHLTIKPKMATRRNVGAVKMPPLLIPDFEDHVKVMVTLLGRLVRPAKAT
jgi:hypothetical protein